MSIAVVQAPTVWEETPLSELEYKPLNATTEASASDGVQHLVVWRPYNGSGIRANRVSATGELLDPTGFFITKTPAPSSSRIAVAWSGSSFLVVWAGPHEGSLRGSDLNGVRVSGDGTVLDPAPLNIISLPGNSANPALSWNGDEYLLVWQETLVTGSDILGARLRPDGSIVQVDSASPLPSALYTPGVFAVSAGPSAEINPVASSGAEGSIVVWEARQSTGDASTQGDIYATFLERSGNRRSAFDISIDTSFGDQTMPLVSGSGTHYLVVWRSGFNVKSLRLARSGEAASSIRTVATSGYSRLSMSWTSVVWLVAWSSGSYTRIARIGSDGILLDPPLIVGSAAGSSGSVQTTLSTLTTGETLLAWRDWTSTATPIVSKAVGSDGSIDVADPLTLITKTPNSQTNLSADCGPETCLAVWQEFDRGASAIWGSFFTRAGGRTSLRFQISLPAGGDGEPAVSWGQDSFLVAWQRYVLNYGDSIHAVRIRPDGAMLDSPSFRISPEATGWAQKPEVAWNGDNWMVVWSGLDWFGPVRAARVSPSGVVLDPGAIQMSPDSMNAQAPHIVWNGAEHLVVWQGHFFDWPGGPFDIYAARLSGSGELLSAATLVAGGRANQAWPQIAWTENVHMVVWEENFSEIRGALIDSVGSIQPLAEPLRGTTSCPSLSGTCIPSGAGVPTIVKASSGFLAVWQQRTASSQWALWGRRISGAGTLEEPAFAVCEKQGDSMYPDLVPSEGTIVIYQRHAPERAYGDVARAFARRLDA